MNKLSLPNMVLYSQHPCCFAQSSARKGMQETIVMNLGIGILIVVITVDAMHHIPEGAPSSTHVTLHY